ncbi:MAG TPA: oligoribonuclease [Polyangia bacterium]|jgi:oligoribonuclease
MPTEQPPVLAWIDLEMTGLDPESCAIVQLAMILTDPELNELAPPLDLTIWQPESVLERMTPTVRTMHERSGLLAGIRASTVSVAEAERRALELLAAQAPYGTARLCGNSVSHDRRFLGRYMPVLEGYLHYRIVDVSTLKELARWWAGLEYAKPEDAKHTALFDIRESINELRFYRAKLMR